MTSDRMPDDEATQVQCLAMIERLERGDYDVDQYHEPPDHLEQAICRLARTLAARQREQHLLERITAQINAGVLLDDILEKVYEDFRELIPYTRIGLSLIAEDGETIISRWVKSDQSIHLGDDYTAPLTSSNLKTILDAGQPRILNDLEAYLRDKPESKSTQLLVEEGIRSSLTCPLIAEGVPVGFLFFSSTEPYAYQDVHSALFQRIAVQLSVIIDKGRLASELAAQKAAIERQNEMLQEVNELKNMFLSIAAHDLRSPLGVIEMAVSMLVDPQMGLSDDEYETIMSNISSQTRHMADLIDNLLDFSLIESGRVDLLSEIIDLGKFLAETVADHEKLAAPKDTSVALLSDLDSLGLIDGDPVRLRQVMDNLISNAVKFSPPGSAVSVWVEQNEEDWRIAVADEGPGIAPEERARLFQPFERLSARPTGGERSTGLGLAITRHIVESHGGVVGVDSEPGNGATFWFTLPKDGVELAPPGEDA